MIWLSKRRSALADEFNRSYVDWREACAEVRAAYERWASCPPRLRARRFATYCAALNREEHAANIHSDWARRASAVAR